jgi:hypothetical protein
MRVLFLDVDGVLNRTGYHPSFSVGLRSWIEPELAARLGEVLRATGARIVLSSDWRLHRELRDLREELASAGIHGELIGVTPTIDGTARWQQIQAWMQDNNVSAETVAIVDDTYDMGPLAARFVRTSRLNGLDAASADALIALFA